MPRPRLSFIHAAELALDVPPRDLPDLSEDERRIAEDASHAALQRLVETALERQVDFVLFAGGTFDERDRSLTAALWLDDAARRLDEAGIRVFVLPGRSDPPAAWRALHDLPENVVCFYERDGEAVAVLRDRRVIATVGARRCSSSPAHRESRHGSGPYSVLLGLAEEWPSVFENDGGGHSAVAHPPADYVALGGRHHRATLVGTDGVIHHPGPMLPLSARQAGVHGFTLVEVDERGTARRSISAAPLRREVVVLLVTDSAEEAIAVSMRAAFEQLRPESVERLWIISWQLAGEPSLVRKFDDDAVRERLRNSLGGKPAAFADVACVHTISITPHRGTRAETPAADDGADVSDVSPANADLERFLATEEMAHAADESRIRDWLQTWRDQPAIDAGRLTQLAKQVDPVAAAAEALRLGAHWFAQEQ
ncbi:MAG: hypothetical protein KY476_05230 [Planctomycetes bacterium]|nr:hypothetical protein [Planctomycetota bacterium]